MFNESTAIQYPKELFDVRLKILRHTNPLRAKIIIFSILYHPFKFSTRDWLTIKMQDLDTLIRHLYSICPTFTELEEKLHETARKINQEEEDLTTTSVILKAMKSLYQNLEIDRAEDLDIKSDLTNSEKVQTPGETDRCQPDESNSDLDDDETQLFDLESANIEFDGKPIQSFITSNSENQGNVEPEEDEELTQPLFLYELDEVSETISYESEIFRSAKPENFLYEFPNLDSSKNCDYLSFNKFSDDQDSGSRSSSLTIKADNDRGNITASLLRKINLEDDVQRLIDEQAQKVRNSLVEAVKYVEKELDKISINHSKIERISIKYPALQQLTDRLSAQLTQIQDILTVQAKNSIAAPLPLYATPTNPQLTTSPATPQTIVALLNPILKPQGIKTFAKQKEGCLHIVLETYSAATLPESQTLNPQKLITLIKTALLNVNLEAIDQIKIYGRKPGYPSPAWIQTIGVPQR
jgi:hypothetical protein